MEKEESAIKGVKKKIKNDIFKVYLWVKGVDEVCKKK